uniref:Integrin subunit alpha 6 n=1 Tax=Anolis carolinensis TaxID=28377 RepID=A0A803SQL4_ANOCA
MTPLLLLWLSVMGTWNCSFMKHQHSLAEKAKDVIKLQLPGSHSSKLQLLKLLVGAPRQKAFPTQLANRTGGLYSCDILTPDVPCTRIKFDEEADLSKESKEDQWMGVTVQSQGPGGKIVTCAHRYEKRQYVNTVQETRDIIGKCYVLSQDLTISDDMDGGEWSFCDGRLRGHEKFGSCQQGVAATFTRDYHYVVFGAPGTYNWKGVVRAEQRNQTYYDYGIFDDGPYEVGDESRRDESLVPVPANSYLGFSLDSGKGIVSQENLTFVSGAPRANHSGAVVLLKKDSDLQRALSLVHVLEGEGLASSFGYDVAVVDLNSDGWQDIVVGAPQYFDRDGEIGGAVYVYINQRGKWEGIKPVRLNGSANSMFGIAVENIGDVNQDGFPDIAVGAPYDGDFGKVYIFHGSRNGINTKPAQVLTSNRIAFFGYSITGNMDLDKNSYPDIAVGSLSDSVSLYRLVGLQIKMTRIYRYTSVNKDVFLGFITLTETLVAEVEITKRIKIGLLGFSKIKDKLRPIPVTVGVTINGSESSSLPRRRQGRSLPELVPILNSNEPSTIKSEVQFLKEGCGSDHTCNSNLKLHYRFCTKEGSEDKFSYFPMENNVPMLVLKDQKDIALEITVTNSPSDPKDPQKDGEDAHEARFIANFPDSLTYSAFREHKGFPEKQLICVANPNGSQVECELGNPFKRNSNVSNVLFHSLCRNVWMGNNIFWTSSGPGRLPITNLGKPLKTFGAAALDILWPKELKGGKWLLYLVSIHSKELGELQCEPPHEINPLGIETSRHSRTKREVAEKQTEGGKGFSLFSERKYKTLECNAEANCVTIRCPLQGLDSKASIMLRARLWNSTFLEEYSKMNYLDILLEASIFIADADNIKLENQATPVSLKHTVALYKGVPWWIVLVAILAGLLMLALLVFLLWKCGFFQRSRYDDSIPRYHAVRIRKEERQIKDGKTKVKKQWITKWSENESYS